MMRATQDLRIREVRALVPPRDLLEQLQAAPSALQTVERSREQIRDILSGRDDRLLVVVGPCSIHDLRAARDYAALLSDAAQTFGGELRLVMRTYFEKPRTTIGWRGLIHDPLLDGSADVGQGLRLARSLLCELTEAGIATATEFLEPLSAPYIADLVSWGAIGARTTECPLHRQLASGLSMPIGFKNGTDGSTRTALDAMHTAAHPHQLFGMAGDGRCALIETTGNQATHLILRGGRGGPNFEREDVAAAARALAAAKLPARVMIDCSHGNSCKDYRRQAQVAARVAEQVASGSAEIMGIMLESFLFEGKQDLVRGAELRYGQSVTDGCMGWLQTEQVLASCARAVQKRRQSALRTEPRRVLEAMQA